MEHGNGGTAAATPPHSPPPPPPPPQRGPAAQLASAGRTPLPPALSRSGRWSVSFTPGLVELADVPPGRRPIPSEHGDDEEGERFPASTAADEMAALPTPAFPTPHLGLPVAADTDADAGGGASAACWPSPLPRPPPAPPSPTSLFRSIATFLSHADSSGEDSGEDSDEAAGAHPAADGDGPPSPPAGTSACGPEKEEAAAHTRPGPSPPSPLPLPSSVFAADADADADAAAGTPAPGSSLSPSPPAALAAPGLVALGDDERDDEDDGDGRGRGGAGLRLRRKRQRAKLTAAVLLHPHPVRSYCLEAQRAAARMKAARERQRHGQHQLLLRPEGGCGCDCGGEEEEEPPEGSHRPRRRRGPLVLLLVVGEALANVPMSVLLDLAEAALGLSVASTAAGARIAYAAAGGTVSVAIGAAGVAWEATRGLDPSALVGAVVALPRDAAHHATDALAGGIQSVATGVESAGAAATLALSALSRAGGGGHHTGPGGVRRGVLRSVGGGGGPGSSVISEKLYRKISRVDSSSRVHSYLEREDEVLSQQMKKRVQRMMHYHVSLRPFVATVAVPGDKQKKHRQRESSFLDAGAAGLPSGGGIASAAILSVPSYDSSEGSGDSEPFMCTPKSFPPTPNSRSHVLARGFRFSEDVVFLARDQLRLQGGLDSENPQTRAMAKALKEGSRLAVFNAYEQGNGVALSCGQHCATKVGSDVYCSTRSMIPVLRNCYVYFEMSVSTPPPTSGTMLQPASLSIGLSTLEMPLNTLVGAWKGSVGLATTGQILAAGQWSSPLDPRMSAYGNSATVGCLVYLHDDSAFETWDGVMVTSAVTFNVNGNVINQMPMGMGPSEMGAVPNQHIPGVEAPWLSEESSSGEIEDRGLSPSTVQLFVAREEELFPTLTLHSPDTQVLSRFCAEDILAKSRREIGAPEGVTIYAIDGSVLLPEGDLFREGGSSIKSIDEAAYPLN